MSDPIQYLRSVKVILEFDDQLLYEIPLAEVKIISDGKTVLEAGSVSLDDFVYARRNFQWASAEEQVGNVLSSLGRPAFEKKMTDAKMASERKKKSLQNKIARRGTFERVEPEEGTGLVVNITGEVDDV